MTALDAVVAALESRGCRPRRKQSGGYTALCPVHEGDGGKHSPSLAVGPGDTQPVVVICGARCSPESIIAALGLSWRDVCEPPTPSKRPVRQAYVPPANIAESVTAACAALDTNSDRLSWLCTERGATPLALAQAEIGWDGERYTIPIRAQHGAILRVKRYLPGGEPKYLEPSGSTPTMYGAETLQDLAAGSLVLVCEGEIGALACRSAGYVAVSTTGGAGSWKPEWGALLEPYDVVAIGDADAPGLKFSGSVVESVTKAGGFAASLVWPKGTPDKTDPADYLGHLKHQASEFAELVAAARECGRFKSIHLASLWDKEEPIPWVIPDMLAERDVLIIGGEPGAGKSALLLDLALALASGEKFLRCAPVLGTPKRVLYLDEENNALLARHRIRMFLAGRGYDAASVESIPFRYLCENSIKLDNDAISKMLHREIRTFLPDWIFFDSLVRFHNGNENDNSEMSRFFTEHLKPIRSGYGCGIALLHHLSKPSKDKPDDLGHRLRGASDLRAMVDGLWGLEGDQNTTKRSLRSEKCRWGPRFDALSIDYTENEESTMAFLEGTAERKEAEDVVIRRLRDAGPEGCLREDLVEALTRSGLLAGAKACSRVLGRMHGQGTVLKRQEGKLKRYWMRTDAPPDAE